jgi:hypothetical protein
VVDERPRPPASEIEKLLLDALRRLPTLRNTQSVTITAALRVGRGAG